MSEKQKSGMFGWKKRWRAIPAETWKKRSWCREAECFVWKWCSGHTLGDLSLSQCVCCVISWFYLHNGSCACCSLFFFHLLFFWLIQQLCVYIVIKTKILAVNDHQTCGHITTINLLNKFLIVVLWIFSNMNSMFGGWFFGFFLGGGGVIVLSYKHWRYYQIKCILCVQSGARYKISCKLILNP